MRDNWSMSTVGALVENLDARRVPVKKSERRPGPYPYYGASGVVDHVDGYLFEGEFLLVAEDGENLNTRKTPIAFLASGKFWVNNHAHILRGIEDVDTRFLAYFLEATDINGYVTGSAQPKLSQGNLNTIPVVLPTLREREGIVHVLRTLDDKIEANRALNETLEATCQALFRSWFVDFDPVVAKGEGRQPPHLTAEVAALFPDRFEDSQIGPVPAGWAVEPLDSIADFENGLALQKHRPAPGEEQLPVIKIAQLRDGAPGTEEWASANIKTSCILDDGDVVFSWSGSLMVTIWCGGRGALNQHLFKVTSDRFPKWFYHQWTMHHLPEFQGIAADKATTMGHIRRHHLTEASCVVASPEVIAAADRLLRPSLESFVAASLESRTLATLRDALLPRLLSGELRVRQAAKLVEEAV